MSRLIVAAAMALFATSLLGSTTLAAPTCGGRPATIVGTSADDELPGTEGPDVIVGLAGTDTIDGKGGRDLICGGGGIDSIMGGDGNDRLFGGPGEDVIDGGDGNDRIFGMDGRDSLFGGRGRDSILGGAGPDFILGEHGDDDIDGGPASDLCRQGPGIGSVRNCERADLSVHLISPVDAASVFTFKVKVKNHGPHVASYALLVDETNHDADCDFAGEGVIRRFGTLAPGATRTRSYAMECVVEGEDPWVEISANVIGHAIDPRSSNDTDSAITDLPSP